MIIGNSYLVLPEFTRNKYRAGDELGTWMLGRCVWVHPTKRFALLEFDVIGGTIRECFFPWELCKNGMKG